jgi:hypothetical protein
VPSCKLGTAGRPIDPNGSRQALAAPPILPTLPTTPPEPARPEPPNGAVAGFLLISVVVLCGGIGAGLGALVDAVALLAIVGVFIGFLAGFALVYSRYRTL